RAGRNGALRRSSRLNTGCFGLLRVAQIHVARRTSSSVHHARCTGSLARRANAKSIYENVIFRSRVGILEA
ncbi:hypothetical protein A2U01_0097692, partial [Trifolium medium]|nr:hypothetical protein [Trifolium medium]